MSTHERYKAEQHRQLGQEYLQALQDYLDDTSRMITDQLAWLKTMRAFVSPEEAEMIDFGITQAIDQNVTAASEYMQELADCGMPVHLLHGDEVLPVEALAFEPDNACYSVGVQLPEGGTLLPLNGTSGSLGLITI